MAARVWSIDHYVPGTYNGTSASSQAMFWSIYNFFNYAAPYIGTQIIAYQKGNSTGYTQGGNNGNGRFDQPNYFGSNSFFVVRFNSASIPFEMCFQLRTFNNQGGTNSTYDFGASPGAPAKLENQVFQAGTQTDAYCIGFAVAMRADLSRSWAGTVLNNGNDSKGTPVWNLAAASASFSTQFWPRNNNPVSGGFGTNRENMMWFNRPFSNATAPVRWHFYADADTFINVQDWGDDMAYDRFIYFGPYTPLSAAHTQPAYCCFADSTFNTARQFGFVAASNPVDTTNYPNGGVPHPTSFASGTMNLVFGTNNLFTTPYYPSNVYETIPKVFNTKYMVFANDALQAGGTNQAGWCGTLEKVQITLGPASNDISGSFIALGTSTTAFAARWMIPWPTGTIPGILLTPFNGTQIVEIF